MPDSPERDFSTYKLSVASPDQAIEMADSLASKSKPHVKEPIAKFLTTVAQIPEVDAVAIEVFPNHLAVEWTSNIAGTVDPEKGEKDNEAYVQLGDGSTARAYGSSIQGVQQVSSAFHSMREALRPTPNYFETPVSDPDPNLNVVSTLHFHNNPGGDPQILIDRYLERRQTVTQFSSSSPDS